MPLNSNGHSVIEQNLMSLSWVFKCFIKSVLTVGLFHPGMRVPRAQKLITLVSVVPQFSLLKAKYHLISH